MWPNVNVQANESQSEECHRREGQRAVNVLRVERRPGIASPCALPIMERGSDSAVSTDSHIQGKPGRTLEGPGYLRGEPHLQEAASGAQA